MKYQELLKMGYPENMVYAERYLGKNSRSYSKFSNQTVGNNKYTPEFGDKTIKVKSFLVDLSNKKLSILGDLHKNFIKDNKLEFFVHPYYLENKDEHLSELINNSIPNKIYNAIPTSSLRTVMFAGEGNPYFIKLNYPFRISRFNRRLRIESIKLQVWASAVINNQNNIQILNDCFGAAYGTGRDAWGYIYRDSSALNNSLIAMPLFALYGMDVKNDNHIPLLTQITNELNINTLDFVITNIVDKIIADWSNTAATTGLIIEPHGQNTLIRQSLDNKFNLVYRDMDVFGVKSIIGKKYSLNELPILLTEDSLTYDDSQILSLIYDRSIGHHLFSYLGDILEANNICNSIEFENIVKNRFKIMCHPEIQNMISKYEYGYADKLYKNNDYSLEIKSKNPKWRIS